MTDEEHDFPCGISPPKLWESSEHGGLQEGNRSGTSKLLESADLKTKLPLEITSLPLSQNKFARIFRVHRKTWKFASHCESSQEFGTEQCQSSKMLEEKTETHLFVVFGIFWG